MSGAPVRVAMISPYPPPGGSLRSGVEWFAGRLAGALAEAGADVTVVAQRHEVAGPEAEDEETHRGVRVLRRFERGAGALRAAVGAALDTRPDVVHLQHEVFLFGGPESVPTLPLALRRLGRAGTGPVVTLHQVVDPAAVDGSFTRLHRVRVPAPVARLALSAVQGTVRRGAAATIVHERSFARVVPGARVVPLGIDVTDAGPAEAADPVVRARLGLSGDRLVVLCFGFLAPYKGLETVLEAAALAGPEVHLVVAGGAHPRLAGRDDYAGALADRYGTVATFTGFVPDPEVRSWFAAADVVLIPHPRPFSSSGPLAQALGFGRPLLLSEAMADCVGAPAELAFAPRPAALARRLTELARSPAARVALADGSAELARGRSWAAVARAHLDTYGEVVRGARDAGGALSPR